MWNVSRRRCRGLVWAIIVGVVLAIPALCRAGSAVGDPLPAMELPDVVTQETVLVASLVEGSVGAIAYMQTSCAACRKELLALRDLQAKYPNLKIVALSVDSGNPARVKRYKEHFAFDFPFLHDPEFKTPELFGFSFTPALVLTDKKGKIALLKGGYRPGDEAELDGEIARLSAE